MAVTDPAEIAAAVNAIQEQLDVIQPGIDSRQAEVDANKARNEVLKLELDELTTVRKQLLKGLDKMQGNAGTPA